MILTEEEVMILEDMKEIEIIQEEIETYLIEKYDLENLEEGLFRWLSKFKKHHIDKDGDIEYRHKDQKLIDRNTADPTSLTPDEQKRVAFLGGLASRAKAAVKGRERSKLALEYAKREEKAKKKRRDNERKTLDNMKKHDLDRAEETELYALMYGDGMSRKKAKKLAKQKRKAQEQRHRDIIDGRIAVADQTASDKELLRLRQRMKDADHTYRDARDAKATAKRTRDNIKGTIDSMRYE